MINKFRKYSETPQFKKELATLLLFEKVVALQPVRLQKAVFAFVVLATLVSCKFWSFQLIPASVIALLETLVSGGLVLLVVTGINRVDASNLRFKSNVFLFVCLPFVSALSAAVLNGQALQLSFLVLKTVFFWLLYFVLHIYKIPVKWVIGLIISVGLVWVILTVGQQFTYPTYYFYVRSDEDQTLLRAGVYRFFLEPKNYALFIVLFCFDRFLKSYSIYQLLLVVVGLVGFYYFGTRQYAVAAVACITLASFMQEGNKKAFPLFFIGVLAGCLLLYREELFGAYIEMTSEQMQDDDDVRLLSAQFFLFDFWSHWAGPIFGNGRHHLASEYGKKVEYLMKGPGYFRGDVGIIGAFNYFGIFYVLNVIVTYVKGLSSKFYTEETKYLKLFFINFLLLILLSDEYSSPSSSVFFCFVLYLVDEAYREKKKLINIYYHLSKDYEKRSDSYSNSQPA